MQSFSNSNYMQIILEDATKLRNSGISEEEIQKIAEKYDLVKALEVQKIKDRIMQMDREEFIEYISSPENISKLQETEFSKDLIFKGVLLDKLFGRGISHISPYGDEVYDIINSYAILMQKNLGAELDELNIFVLNNSFGACSVVIYSDESSIVSAIAVPKSNQGISKIKELPIKSIDGQSYEIQIEYDGEPETPTKEVIKTDRCIENFTYTRVTVAEEVSVEEDKKVSVVKQPSVLERIMEKIRISERRYDKLKKYGAPEIIMEKEEQIAEKLRGDLYEETRRIEEKRKKKKLLFDTIQLTEDSVGEFSAVKAMVHGIENTNEQKPRSSKEEL